MTKPLWKGPYEDGITQSLLSLFLVCRERFRIATIEGLRPIDRFNHKPEYGTFWHILEEHYDPAKGFDAAYEKLLAYASTLARKYPTDQTQILHWLKVCRTQFNAYIDYWAARPNPADKRNVSLLSEYAFNVTYRLPSGRKPRLRGKFDGVFMTGSNAKNKVIMLQENKTKGDIDEYGVKTRLQFDLQTMYYLTALDQLSGPQGDDLPVKLAKYRLGGVRYNVVRRPLSGGIGSIRQRKGSKADPIPESDEAFYARLGETIRENADTFFMRWVSTITLYDLDRFCGAFLDPMLEQLCDWWDFCSAHDFDVETILRAPNNRVHWRLPYGIYNPILEDRNMDIDDYLNTGSQAGLQRADTIFPEL